MIGWNAGEWGGAVWWFSAKGTNRYLVAEKRVIGFFPDGDGFLAPAGLAHLSDSHGEMIRLFKKEGRWSSQTVIGLGAAPTAAVLIEPDTMIVATTDRLLRYQVGGRLSVILNEIPWDPIFPNSIAADDDGRIFLGMRGGVAKVEKAVFGYRAYWLSPPANMP